MGEHIQQLYLNNPDTCKKEDQEKGGKLKRLKKVARNILVMSAVSLGGAPVQGEPIYLGDKTQDMLTPGQMNEKNGRPGTVENPVVYTKNNPVRKRIKRVNPYPILDTSGLPDGVLTNAETVTGEDYNKLKDAGLLVETGQSNVMNTDVQVVQLKGASTANQEQSETAPSKAIVNVRSSVGTPIYEGPLPHTDRLYNIHFEQARGVDMTIQLNVQKLGASERGRANEVKESNNDILSAIIKDTTDPLINKIPGNRTRGSVRSKRDTAIENTFLETDKIGGWWKIDVDVIPERYKDKLGKFKIEYKFYVEESKTGKDGRMRYDILEGFIISPSSGQIRILSNQQAPKDVNDQYTMRQFLAGLALNDSLDQKRVRNYGFGLGKARARSN